jgi:hypothetical protein
MQLRGLCFEMIGDTSEDQSTGYLRSKEESNPSSSAKFLVVRNTRINKGCFQDPRKSRLVRERKRLDGLAEKIAAKSVASRPPGIKRRTK